MVMRGQGKHIRFFLKIYDASTASHAENKCSTYHRYASALFAASFLYLHRLVFSKTDSMHSLSILRYLIRISAVVALSLKKCAKF